MASSANVGSAKSPTFKHLFELLDKDRNGVIDPNEFLYIKDLYKVIDSEVSHVLRSRTLWFILT